MWAEPKRATSCQSVMIRQSDLKQGTDYNRLQIIIIINNFEKDKQVMCNWLKRFTLCFGRNADPSPCHEGLLIHSRPRILKLYISYSIGRNKYLKRVDFSASRTGLLLAWNEEPCPEIAVIISDLGSWNRLVGNTRSWWLYSRYFNLLSFSSVPMWPGGEQSWWNIWAVL